MIEIVGTFGKTKKGGINEQIIRAPDATEALLHRLQNLMSSSPLPSISTELLITVDGELNPELHHFVLKPPSNPD